MKKESLIKAREGIIKLLSCYGIEELEDVLKDIKKIDKVDRGELMINEYHFLDPNRYSNNVKVLQRENKKRSIL